MTRNRRIVLSSRPQGNPDETNFRFEDIDIPEPKDGEVLVKALYVSVDPYMRSRMNDTKSYVPPFALDEPIEGGLVARVEQSKHADFKQGDIVSSLGMLKWQEYQTADSARLRKVDTDRVPVTAPLGVLGIPGLTAWVGLSICNPAPGETFVVSAAAGAVGSVAGQIAKLKGCRVVGTVGSDIKAKYLLDELGFDAVINYKTDDLHSALKVACPDGVDMYFDNVGGDVTNAVVRRLNDFSRIALCGQISQYNLLPDQLTPAPDWSRLLVHRTLLKGFIVSDYLSQAKEAMEDLAEWIAQGKITYRDTIIEGFENIPRAFLGLFTGENIGKQVVKV
ncbi:NADP-dependent oxidoreductase [Alicyclobacillus sp. SO9]|uniref:NADP-dependent oxidoreductase n=1 Tax=Alicyclobacillus sp. SO9 TaxID=2665646 RepID=UPI0018E80A57|nr:NADP-dependent oxidoreductase [Alicyclobacillus sp. SO9]QQE77426.1 NADP-dependent oxidoreductase [Alicyclobacillus sp. SO9]